MYHLQTLTISFFAKLQTLTYFGMKRVYKYKKSKPHTLTQLKHVTNGY